jgi:DNA invertase Pin-like site-specific DNA recombinase
MQASSCVPLGRRNLDERTADAVLVWKVDRISRSIKDLLGTIRRFRERGVEFAAVEQDFDTSDPVGLLTLHVLGSFAQFERELLVERTKEGHLRRLHGGDWSCGPAPLGYRKVDGKLVEVPEEADVVRRIFALYLELKTFRGVARRLNAEGATTRQGKAWSMQQVKYVLTNPVYSGANVYERHRSGDTRVRKRAEWRVVPGTRGAACAVAGDGSAKGE